MVFCQSGFAKHTNLGTMAQKWVLQKEESALITTHTMTGVWRRLGKVGTTFEIFEFPHSKNQII